MLKSWGWGGVVGGPCDYCVSPVQRIGFLGFLDFLDLRVRIWGLLGQGIGDLDSGLTIHEVDHRSEHRLEEIDNTLVVRCIGLDTH